MPKYVFGRPADQVVQTIPWLPMSLQRRIASILQRLVSGRMEDFGLPTPNHRFLEAHPTVSSELLLRLGSGDAVAKPDIAELQGDRVRFADGSVEPVDAIIWATGYRISFPFFDPEFISAPGNVVRLYKRMFKPGIDDLAFIGLGQAIPTIFPFAEVQSKLAGRWLAGEWALPPAGEMEDEIRARRADPPSPLRLAPAAHDAAGLLRVRVRPAQARRATRGGASPRRRGRQLTAARTSSTTRRAISRSSSSVRSWTG